MTAAAAAATAGRGGNGATPPGGKQTLDDLLARLPGWHRLLQAVAGGGDSRAEAQAVAAELGRRGVAIDGHGVAALGEARVAAARELMRSDPNVRRVAERLPRAANARVRADLARALLLELQRRGADVPRDVAAALAADVFKADAAAAEHAEAKPAGPARAGARERERERDRALHVTRFADLCVDVGDADNYVIKELLPKPALVVVYGEAGSGKTFFVSRAAFDAAIERAFLGLRTKRSRVAYLAAEAPVSVHRRFAAWRRREGIDDAPLIVVHGDVDLLRPGAADAVIERIRAEGGADFVAVDTAAACAPGMDENTAEGMGSLIAVLMKLRDELGACVVLVHHAGKDTAKGARGWSGLRAAADVEIEVRHAGGVRVATVRKSRDGQAGQELAFELRPFVIGTDADGEEVTTCEVVAVGAGARRAPAREPRGANQRIVLAALREAVAAHGRPHPGSSVIPKGAAVVDAETLARYALPRLPQDGDGRNTAETRRREALSRAILTLQADGHVGVWGDLRWLL